MPIYSVSQSGKFALTLDFSRLHSYRKGYGYCNTINLNKNEKCPDDTCIWYINIENREARPILKYTDLINFEKREDMDKAVHKVNHIMINPSGDRFMVLHRWFVGKRKYTRLLTMDCDGRNIYNLNDDDMTSHCFWKNNTEILAFARKKGKGNGYYLFKDNTNYCKKMLESIENDGHPSYSPDRKFLITDTYPNSKRMASLILFDGNKITTLCKVFAPFKYDNDVRCDLHPRWSRKGDKICFDSVCEGKRGLYITKINNDQIGEFNG